MRVTVAICTWNRCALLDRTLEQATRLIIPEGVEWELLVVNNNCTDATDQVIESYRDRLPIRTLFEPRPGKSNALNLATREATGDYILWTDDDVLVDPEWLTAYCRAFERWPDSAVFGGSVEPWFEGTPPAWLAEVQSRVQNAFATRILGGEPIPLSVPEVLPFGANMAVRTTCQRRYPYDPALGPRPESPLRGEEITIVKAMLEAGLSGWWIPDARVRHWIPKHRQTTRFLREYYAGWGEYLVALERAPPHLLLFGRPRWVWKEIVLEEIKYLARRLTSAPDVWIEHLIAAAISRGKFRGYSK